MAAEGEWPKVDGDILYGSEASIIAGVKVIYTGTGFDSTAGSTSNVELTALTSAQVASAKYVIVKILFSGLARGAPGGEGIGKIKIQVKETGGAYGDDLAYKTVVASTSDVESNIGITTLNTLEWLHTLTAGEKTNGLQFNIFSDTPSTGNGTATVTNIQTSLTVIGGV